MYLGRGEESSPTQDSLHSGVASGHSSSSTYIYSVPTLFSISHFFLASYFHIFSFSKHRLKVENATVYFSIAGHGCTSTNLHIFFSCRNPELSFETVWFGLVNALP